MQGTKDQNIGKYGQISTNCVRTEGIPEKMRGTWVGALCSWCHCPLESGTNLTATRRCGTTTPANPSDGPSGYCAHPAIRQLPRNQNGKTTEERREGSTLQKDKPDALPRDLERDARGLEKKSGQGWVTRRSGLLALWPLGL